MSENIWLMDSDFCMNCGTELADVDGYCWWCWEQLEDEWSRNDSECEECGGPCRWEYADRYEDSDEL